ncbi:MAG: carboxypeptidase-like regulatory domain-containing protein, partial [Arcicella sp.]|nr:carboxypeptidase-like regulatory domain-containing protein [Arcicella sp.]
NYLFAQSSISGEVQDILTQKPLKNAYVSLINMQDSTKKRSVPTNNLGKFKFSSVLKGSFSLRVSFVGFVEYRQNIKIDSDTLVEIPTIFLEESSKELNEVKVVGQVAATIQKVDTVQFNAKAFKVNRC